MSVYAVGNIIREARKRKGLTQEEICHGICSVSALSKIENGSMNPTLKTMRSLAERAGLSPTAIDFCVSKADLKKYQLELKILHKIYHNEDLSGLSKLYSDVMCTEDKADMQMLEIIKIFENIKGHSYNQICRALDYTMVAPQMTVKRKIRAYTEQEMILLCELSDNLIMNHEVKDALGILESLFDFWNEYNDDFFGRSKQYLYLLHKIIVCCDLEGDYKKALKLCMEAIEVCKKYDNLFLLLNFLCDYGILNYKLDKKEEAVIWLKKGLSLCSIIEDARYQVVDNILAEINRGKIIVQFLI